jgi:predicted RecA/RadA family phage recombinase
MRNYVQTGDTVTFTAPYAVQSGDGLQVGTLFGVAANAAANGAQVEGKTSGVFDLTALATDVGSFGTKVYWDNGNRRVTVTVGSNMFIGALVGAKANGETTARVRLNGVSV